MIRVDAAGFRYGNGPWIFRGCSFQVHPGDILAILGPNGRGKTSLLRAILGVLPLREGSIQVQGDMGYVPQNGGGAFFSYSVLEMVIMGRIRHMGFFASPNRQDREAAKTALGTLGLLDFQDRSFAKLSGGERQLVLIARALASGCSCLLLDEPTSALDFKNQKIVLDVIREVRNHGLTVVFTTHGPHHALHVANRCLLMFDERHFAFGDSETVLNNQALRQLYETDIRKVHIAQKDLDLKTVIPVYQ